MSEPKPRRPHTPFYAATITFVVVGLLSLVFEPEFAVQIPALAFFIVYLGMMAHRLPTISAKRLQHSAATNDEPVAVILVVTLSAVLISIYALFMALNGKTEPKALQLVLAFGSVSLGWMTIHTMAAMHYAHLYWSDGDKTDEAIQPAGGLEFPETPEPAGYDFLYFAFVIGMTAQTSDVAISTTSMRKINLLHSIVSFFFNTVLVAAAVNAAVSLAP